MRKNILLFLPLLGSVLLTAQASSYLDSESEVDPASLYIECEDEATPKPVSGEYIDAEEFGGLDDAQAVADDPEYPGSFINSLFPGAYCGPCPETFPRPCDKYQRIVSGQDPVVEPFYDIVSFCWRVRITWSDGSTVTVGCDDSECP